VHAVYVSPNPLANDLERANPGVLAIVELPLTIPEPMPETCRILYSVIEVFRQNPSSLSTRNPMSNEPATNVMLRVVFTTIGHRSCCKTGAASLLMIVSTPKQAKAAIRLKDQRPKNGTTTSVWTIPQIRKAAIVGATHLLRPPKRTNSL
jgi:hypothetical protein